MPGGEIETRYCRYVEEVLNHHHLDRLAAYLIPDVVVHAPGVSAGLAGARRILAAYLRAFPDLHLSIDTLLAVDGELLARLTATGTHTGPFLGLAPPANGSALVPSSAGGCGMAGVLRTGSNLTCSGFCSSWGTVHGSRASQARPLELNKGASVRRRPLPLAGRLQL